MTRDRIKARIRIGRSVLDRLPAPETVAIEYFDTALTGFGVRVSPRGLKTFVARGRDRAGSSHRVTLGRYPIMSPEQARQDAMAFLAELSAGQVPVRSVRTSDALDRWLKEHGRKLKPRTLSDYKSIAETYVKPALGRMPVADVTRADVMALHHEVATGERMKPGRVARGKQRERLSAGEPELKGKNRRANYVLAIVRSFMSWAEGAGLRPMGTNPALRIEPFPERSRERFLSEDEIGRAAAAIDEAEFAGWISPFGAAGLRLAMLTGARSGEISNLRWAEVDLDRRMLFLADSKTGKKPIWLSTPAIEVLRTLPRISANPYVLAGSAPGAPYRNLSRAWIKVRGLAGLDDVRLHDLRHSFASVGAASGHSLPIIGRMLGHATPTTTNRYAHLAAAPVAEANEQVGLKIGALMKRGATPATGGDE